MGCGNVKKNIENEMMIIQLERVNIQMERMKNLKLLENMDGHIRKCPVIPDFIDPQFAKKKLELLKNSSSFMKEDENYHVPQKKRRFRRKKLKKGKKKRRRKKKIKDNEDNENNENKINIEDIENNNNKIDNNEIDNNEKDK